MTRENHSDNTCSDRRAAFYARVSSERQSAAGTIDSQIAQLRQRLEQDGLRVQEELAFIDDGHSGDTLERPALERLRDMAYHGVIDCLYVSCPDRLARRFALQMLLVEELARCGVEIRFLNRDIGRTPEDDMLLQMQGVMAEYERAKILERSRRGKLYAARRGDVGVLAGAPYGYRYVSKSQGSGVAGWNIQLEEAGVVRQVFRWVGLERLSLHEVCRRLEKQGIPAPRGGSRWDRSTLWGMLRNPAYAGSAAYGKRCAGPRRQRLRPYRGAAEQPRRPHGLHYASPQDWVRIPVPALVEQDLFDAVAGQLEENRRRARLGRRGPRHLLQGLAVCGCCGHACCGFVYPKHDDGSVAYGYYRCLGADARLCGGRVCPNRSVNRQALDEAVWDDVKSLLEDPQRVAREFQRRLEAGRKPGEESPEHTRLSGAAAAIRRGIAVLIDALADGLVKKAEFEPRVTGLRTRLEKLEAEIQSRAAAENAEREMRVAVESLEAFAVKVRGRLENADWQTRRDVIAALVKKVEIGKEDIRVVYKVDVSPFEPSPLASPGGAWKDCWRRRATAPIRS